MKLLIGYHSFWSMMDTYVNSELIIINDLLALRQVDKPIMVDIRTITFLYNWLSYGNDDIVLSEQEIWSKVAVKSDSDIVVFRAACDLEDNVFLSWTKERRVAEEFKKQSDEMIIFVRNLCEPGVLYYPLCDAVKMIQGPINIAWDEIMDKADAEQEYVVLKQG